MANNQPNTNQGNRITLDQNQIAELKQIQARMQASGTGNDAQMAKTQWEAKIAEHLRNNPNVKSTAGKQPTFDENALVF